MRIRDEINQELWRIISRSYEAELYSSSILEAVHYLSDLIREKANAEGDGIELINRAFGSTSPRIKINRLETETEKSEQKGVEFLLRGLYQAIRNPRSHEQITDDQQTANAIILFVNYLADIVGHAKAFSVEEWIKRVVDPDFVASERYAQLLVAEIPQNKYLDALIVIYRNKNRSTVQKLRKIFDELYVRVLASGKTDDFASVVSEELKLEQNENTIAMSLQLIPPDLWPKLDEVSRIRIEHKLVRAIQKGKLVSGRPDSDEIQFGLLAIPLIQYLSNRDLLHNTLRTKLFRQRDEKGYALEFIGPNRLISMIDSGVEELQQFALSFSSSWIVIFVQTGQQSKFDTLITSIAEQILASSTTVRQHAQKTIVSLPPKRREQLFNQISSLEQTEPDYYSSLIDANSPEDEDIEF